MSEIYLLLGTNLGNKYKNLERARELLVSHMITIKKESQIYETAAWGKEDQDSFLNQVIEVETGKSPQRVLEICHEVEQEMGRQRHEKWGSRLIDIDILYYQAIDMDDHGLQIPHPEIQNRRFTLVPMNEVAPNFVHPISKKTQEELLAECKDPLEVKAFEYEVY